jgi:hypothetical protein
MRADLKRAAEILRRESTMIIAFTTSDPHGDFDRNVPEMLALATRLDAMAESSPAHVALVARINEQLIADMNAAIGEWDEDHPVSFMLLTRCRAALAAVAQDFGEFDRERHRAHEQSADAQDARRYRLMYERLLNILTEIHGFLTAEDIKLPDGRTFEFSNPEIEHEMLRGLSDAIRSIPKRLDAALVAGAVG